ncbi:S-layer homology domain-containing protein, partial [Paenibacillus castaneae]|uniref:S-layer homology domain-containing protein n=1 Tax=Paenibacillus castaneae TaxID=474957 RepID=UPI003144E4A8
TANDAANKIVGLDSTMEFKVDGGSYVKYDGTNAPNLAGSHTVLVRVAADDATGTPAGAETTLTFTPNPPAPAAPNVSANDAANTIVGLDSTMEFKVDNGSYVKYDGTNAPNLAGSHTVLVRVAADDATGTPAGAETTLTFTPNPPAPGAPDVTANDAANTIVGLDSTMEFKVDGGSYVKYNGLNMPDLSGTHTVLVRVAADDATGTPAGLETTLTFTPNPPAPAAPDVTANDAANTIVGLNSTMEFKVDGGGYVKYDGTNAPNLAGSHTVLVRVAADDATGTPAGVVTTLTFTPNPPAPAAPSVTANDAANTIVGLDSTMEFKVDGGSYVKYDGTNAPNLAGSHTVLVRVAADDATGTPAGAEMTLTFTPNPPAPAAPSVSANDAANKIVGLNSTMEFKVDGGSYVKYNGLNMPDLSGSHTVLVRVAADETTGTPAGAETTLTFTPNPPAPAAPSVSANDAANTIVGLNSTMEFKVDGGSYVKYDGTNAPNLAGSHTVLVRVAADDATETPAGAETTLTFTPNPPAPAAPSVTANDAANTIVGLDSTMEFKVDGGSYVKYDGTNAPNLAGSHTVLVRVAADETTGTPAGLEKTLTFTPNPPAPAAPSVTANDAANTIVGLDSTMEFKVDGGSYVKYDGTNAPNLAGSHTVLVRVTADDATGTPAGAEKTLTFTPNPPAPAAPNVSANDAANTIVGLDSTMEFKVDGGSYVKYDGTNAPNLAGSHTLLIRVAADDATGTPAGAETTLTFTPNPPAPAAPSVTANDAANMIIGLNSTMEFKVDGGSYVKYDGTNAPNLAGSHTVLVRVAADDETGTPAGAETTLTFTPNPPAPTAPSVTANDAANMIIGLNSTMEFKVDGGSYVKYDGTNAPNLAGSHTVLVRVAADDATGTPAGAETTLTFTPNPPAPGAPDVTANDAANTIVGLDSTMEFKVDGGSYVKYDGTNAPNLAGSHTVLVRVAADTATGTPAGAETTLAFMPNPPSAPMNVTAVAGNGQATITFTVPTESGDNPITGYEIIASPGNIKLTGNSSPFIYTGLTNGTSYTFIVKAINASGISSSSSASQAVTPSVPNPTLPPVTPEPPKSSGVDVLVNGKVEKAGTASTEIVNGQTVTTITIDQKKLDEKLSAEGLHAVVTVPVNLKSDAVVAELNGQMIKNMEDKLAVLEIKTERATYTLPAEQINIKAISDLLGKNVLLQDIKIEIEVAVPVNSTVKIVENAAVKGEFSIVIPPLDFTVKAISGTTVIDVSKFDAYVGRTIALPDGVDPNKITTGVVVESDGSVRHVPTKVITIDGKYYAVVNSLTNSTYSIVWHPLEFKDVAKHWSKEAVNDMGSRMVINGIGNDLFNPNEDITRAEFAAIIVRGLGLKLENGELPFSDVKSSDWYASVIQTAYSYNLINGFTDGTFRPNDKITREQAMAIIAKAMKITELAAKLAAKDASEVLSPFNDYKKISLWARDSIADCLQAGIVSGRSSALIAPKENITRAEVAAIVQRLLQKSELI